MHDLRMALPAVCAWGVAAFAVSANAQVAVGMALIAVGIAGATACTGRPVVLVLIAATAVAGICAIAAWRMTAIGHAPTRELAEEGRLATIEAVVRGDARTFASHGRSLVVVDVTVRRIETRQDSYTDRAPVTVFADESAERLVVGERVIMIGRLSPPESSDSAAKFNALRIGPAEQKAWWWAASSRMRASVTESVQPTGEEPSALIPALVHGDDSRLSDEVRDDFQRSGLTHLLAVSGTNLTIVLVAILLLGRALGIRSRGQWVLGVLAVAAFVVLARPDPSVLRAAAMGSVGLAAIGYGSRGGIRALSWAVLVLLTIDPWLSRSVGFILSVCATAGILLLGPRLADALGRHMPRWCALTIAIPVAAQLACTPVVAAISGEVSLVSVLANIAAGPAVAPATIAGLLGGVVGLFWEPAGHVVGFVAGMCARWILTVGHRCAALPGASTEWGGSLWLLGALCVLVAALLIVLGRRPTLVWGLGLGLMMCLWRPPTPGWPAEGWVMVSCDVDQGDATVLNTGDGSAVVVDAGPDPTAVDSCLDRLGVRRVRLMVFTHAHADHIDGWPGVKRGRRVDQVVVGPTGGPGRGLPRHVVEVGETFEVGALAFTVIGPTGTHTVEVDGIEGPAANNASIVLLVETRGVRLLLTGDAEPEAQDAMLRGGQDLRAEVMKMPHHGSARQSEEFFRAVGARVVTISNGLDNDYGHPAPAALHLLKMLGASAYRTDLQGDIAIIVRDSRLSVLTR